MASPYNGEEDRATHILIVVVAGGSKYTDRFSKVE